MLMLDTCVSVFKFILSGILMSVLDEHFETARLRIKQKRVENCYDLLMDK